MTTPRPQIFAPECDLGAPAPTAPRSVARERRDFQRTALGRYRSQLTHPCLPDRRIELRAETLPKLRDYQARVRELGHEYRYGRLSLEEVLQALERMVSGPRPPMLVQDAWDTWVATVTLDRPDKAGKYKSVWKHHLAAHFGGRYIEELHDGHFLAWETEEKKRGYRARTIRDAFWLFAAAVRHAKRGKKVARLPWDEYRPPTKDALPPREKAWTKSVDELAKLVHAAFTEDAEHWARGEYADLGARVVVIGLCGLRNGEAAGLGWDLINLDQGIVRVQYQVLDQWKRLYPGRDRPDFPLKNKPHTQALHPDALAALKAQKAQLERFGAYRADGPVFPEHGRWSTRPGSWRANANCVRPEKMKELARRAGLAKPGTWTVHALRHSFASLEADAGGSLKAVQERTGHASLKQLEGYVHAMRAALPASAIPALPKVALRLEAQRAIVQHQEKGEP
jgi:integrase